MPMAVVPLMLTTSNAAVWQNWNIYGQTGTTANTTNLTSNVVWANWNGIFSTAATTGGTLWIPQIQATTGWVNWNTGYEETREQRQEREQRAAEAGRCRAIAAGERAQAKDRALELLGLCLSGEQMASYRDKGWFEVRSNKGRRWRIRDRGQSGNVDLMPEIGEQREASYCAHPPGALPDPDAHLAQVLTLATDEDAFLRVANCHYRRTG